MTPIASIGLNYIGLVLLFIYLCIFMLCDRGLGRKESMELRTMGRNLTQVAKIRTEPQWYAFYLVFYQLIDSMYPRFLNIIDIREFTDILIPCCLVSRSVFRDGVLLLVYYLIISAYSLSFPLLSRHLRNMTEASTLAGEKVLGSLSKEMTLSKMVLQIKINTMTSENVPRLRQGLSLKKNNRKYNAKCIQC